MSKKQKLILLIVVALLFVGSLYFYHARITSLEKKVEEYMARAEQLERQGELAKAIEQLEDALRYVPRNDVRTYRELQEKLRELKEKKEKEEELLASEQEKQQNTEATETADGGSTQETQEPAEPAKVEIGYLGKLLPTSFAGLEGSLNDGLEIAYVRFDDVANDTTYLIYIYRHETAADAANFVQKASSEVYPLNRKEVPLQGEFAGMTGYYAEKENGDAGLFFSYAQLSFECLLSSTTLQGEEKLNKLLELQQQILKPQ